MKKIFDRRLVSFAKLTLVPKSFDIIPDPEFKPQMKYVCISPMIPQPPFLTDETGTLPEPLDPRSHEFSDLFYDAVLDRMEKAGFTEEQISSFVEFEIVPDPGYIQKISETHKKFARIYRTTTTRQCMVTCCHYLHAHPQVQKFIWECGIGNFTTQGYGMVDVVGGISAEVVPEE
ncbi:MAG: hypothetical protein IPJ66_18190 [Bacteroidetes bacterium]|nr:hypothetical protein [Bacteroidota bacterium]